MAALLDSLLEARLLVALLGRNLQPCGRLISDGGMPLIECSFSGLGRSRRGIDPSRPQVYGCWGS